MQFGGRYLFEAPRLRVWRALNDTDVLKAAIPGCRLIEWTGESTLELEIQVNFGVVQPVFGADLELRDVRPAERYTLAGKGRGGLLGMAAGAADIVLSDAADGRTELSFSAEGGADGGIMKLGRTLLGNSAQKVIDGFFAGFGEAMGTTVIPIRS
jgi:carbon monoxide dehydrogenase subunit G